MTLKLGDYPELGGPSVMTESFNVEEGGERGRGMQLEKTQPHAAEDVGGATCHMPLEADEAGT